MSEQQKQQQVLDVFEEKGKLFLKTFLVSDSLNLARWKIDKDHIPKHIQKFVGRPFILTQERGHPLEFNTVKIDWDNINNSIGGLLQAQEKYRIGTIRKVEPISQQNAWAAYVEISDPNAVQAFKSGHIPKYVSPAIFRLNRAESPETTTDYEPLHLAAVDIPAYGYKDAGIRGACEGDIVTCTNQLATASAPPISDCGFCVRGVLEGFKNNFEVKKSNSSLVPNPVNQASVNLSVNTTDSNNNPQPQQQPAQQQPQQVPSNTTPQQSQPTTIVQVPQPRPEGAPFEVPSSAPVQSSPKKEEEVKPAEGNKPGQTEGDNTKKDEVATLRATVEALLSRVKELDAFKSDSEKSMAEKLLAAKRSKIEAIIPADYARSKEERNKAVEALMRFDDGPQLDYILEKFVTPTINPPAPTIPNVKGENRGVKQAGIDSITKRVASKRLSDFAAPPVNQQTEQPAPAVQQASDAAVLKRVARICAMSDIVANHNFGGGF